MADTSETGRTGGRRKRSDGFSDEERAAMQERAEELTQASRRPRKAADAESDVLARIAEMPEADRAMAERVHAIVKEVAPGLVPRLWYGMPAYAKDGRSSASSRRLPSSRRATPRSGSTMTRRSTRARCGRPRSRSPGSDLPRRRRSPHSSRGPCAEGSRDLVVSGVAG